MPAALSACLNVCALYLFKHAKHFSIGPSPVYTDASLQTEANGNAQPKLKKASAPPQSGHNGAVKEASTAASGAQPSASTAAAQLLPQLATSYDALYEEFGPALLACTTRPAWDLHELFL
eukprot:2736684-Pleurochrysis_carterae.AAC.3